MATNYLDSALRPYNSKFNKKPRTQGKVVPVPKRSNPNIRPTPGGGSGPVSTASPSSLSTSVLGAQAQQNRLNQPVNPTIDVNYESDPVLARIRALGQQNVANAESEAAALRKQAVIDTGLADVGAELGLDAATLQAARENPLSVAARLANEARLRESQLNESLNQQNLFFSGHRGTQLGELARSQMAEQADLTRDLRAALGGIDQGVLEARQAASLDEQGAMEAAAEAMRQQSFENALLDALAGTAVSDQEAPLWGYPEPIYEPPPLTPEEELMLLLGGGGYSAFSNYAL